MSKHLRGQVPDNPGELFGESSERPRKVGYRFTEKAYGAIAPEETSSAAKLADSAIAPIVAAARGYWTAQNTREFDQMMNDAQISKRSPQRTETKPTLDEGADVLAMPWYSIKEIGKDHPQPKAYQWRPSVPRKGKDGKANKYETPPGPNSNAAVKIQMPLDIHPSTPGEWIASAPKVIFAEGLLKGDAALSAYLAWAGADSKLLGYTGSDARTKLMEFMDSIDADDRILIIRPTSVTTFLTDKTFHTQIDFEGREVWVGVDGDVSVNPRVWDQTSRFFEHCTKSGASNVMLLAPKGDEDAKDGLDDFLSHTGDFDDLLGHLQPRLPERPVIEGEELPAGAWRISEDGTFCERKNESKDSDGNITGFTWSKTGINYGAVITDYIIHRDPTDAEMRSGLMDPDKESPRDMVELRFSWKKEGSVRTADVQIPMKLLGQAPDQWLRNDEAWVPRSLLSLPGFPPRGSDAMDFMDAVRRASDHATHQVHWRRNGWVPVPESSPAFIVGEDVIAADDRSLPYIHSGVTSEEVGTLDQFGIGGPEDELVPHPGGGLGEWVEAEPSSDGKAVLNYVPDERQEAAEKRRQIAEDAAKVRYLLFDNKPFTYDAYPAIILATAMRPLMVVAEAQQMASLYIYGEKGRGKTMSAEFIMNFWASASSGFIGQKSGSVSDTPVAKETSVARTPIWFMDDLAPTGSQQAYEKKEREVAETIRNVFNRTAKARSTINLKSRELNKPYAQLIVTAENPLSDPSAAERTMRLPFRNGTLSPKEEGRTKLVEREAKTGVFARMTRHFAEWMVQKVAAEGWAEVREETERHFLAAADRAEAEIVARGGNHDTANRDGKVAAEMTVPLVYFHEFLQEAGVVWEDLMAGFIEEVVTDDDGNPTTMVMSHSLEELSPSGNSEETPTASYHLVEAVWEHTAEISAASAGSSPGARLMTALRTMLRSGKAHISNPTGTGMPPVLESEAGEDEDASGSPRINAQLGWTMRSAGEWQSNGTNIGELVKKDCGYVIFFDPQSAFTAAQDNYRGDLIKGGESRDAMWGSLEAKGYSTGKVRGISKETGGRRWWKTKAGGTQVTGIPIHLNTVLDTEPD